MPTYLTMHTSYHLRTYTYIPNYCTAQMYTHTPAIPTTNPHIHHLLLLTPTNKATSSHTAHSLLPSPHASNTSTLTCNYQLRQGLYVVSCMYIQRETNTSTHYIRMHNLRMYEYTNMAECTYCTYMAVHTVSHDIVHTV